jgi:type 1 fimbrial protein
MDFKKNMVAGAVMALASVSASAADMNAGVVHFTGSIIEPSCTIQGNSGVDNNVPLGTFMKSTFDTVGKETALTPFSITLANCPLRSDGLQSIQLTFTGTTAPTKTSTLLDVSKITSLGETAATGIGIAVSLAGQDTRLITMDGAEGQIFIPLSGVPNDTVRADLNARYKSFSADVTPGPADADMTVNILYR